MSAPALYGRISFQFHKGTIKTGGFFDAYSDWVTFQFHKGTIKTLKEKQMSFFLLSYFNSIKVRLKRVLRKEFCYSSN